MTAEVAGFRAAAAASASDRANCYPRRMARLEIDPDDGVRRPFGPGRGGAVLTPFGENLLARWRVSRRDRLRARAAG